MCVRTSYLLVGIHEILMTCDEEGVAICQVYGWWLVRFDAGNKRRERGKDGGGERIGRKFLFFFISIRRWEARQGEASRIKGDWLTYLADSFLNAVYSRYCCDVDTKSRETIITLRRLFDRKMSSKGTGRRSSPPLPPLLPLLLYQRLPGVLYFKLKMKSCVRVCVSACVRAYHCVPLHPSTYSSLLSYSSSATAAAATTPFLAQLLMQSNVRTQTPPKFQFFQPSRNKKNLLPVRAFLLLRARSFPSIFWLIENHHYLASLT